MPESVMELPYVWIWLHPLNIDWFFVTGGFTQFC